MSNVEILLDALVNGRTVNVTPMSRTEILLDALVNGKGVKVVPMSRIETLLNQLYNIGISGGGGSGADLTAFLEGTTTTFTIPANVDNLRDGAFYGCKLLTEINVDAGNASYKSVDGVLYTIDGTTLVAYPAGKEALEFIIPNSVAVIRDGAFGGCDENLAIVLTLSTEILNAGEAYPAIARGINTAVIQDGTTFLSNDALINLTGIDTLRFEANDCEIEHLYGYDSKGSQVISGTALSTTSAKKIVIDGTATTRYLCYKNANVEEVVLGSNVSSIPENAFGDNTKLSRVVCDGIINVAFYAFSGCSKLSSFTFNKVETIGQRSFAYCSNLGGDIDFTKLTSIDGYAFTQCRARASVVLRECLQTLAGYAFYQWYGLEEITLPRSLTIINPSTFAYCSSLRKVTILNKNAHIDSTAFTGCPETMEIHGYIDSTAHTFATENGFTFIPIEE